MGTGVNRVAALGSSGPLAAGPLVEATVCTPVIEADVELWYDVLGYQIVDDGPVSDADADRWEAGALAGHRTVRLSPPDGDIGGVRLVAQAHGPGYIPLRTYGWAAVEIIVDDLAAVAARLAAVCKVVGEPNPVGGRRSGLTAMQVLTPGGVPLYVTEVSSAPHGFDLPRAITSVGRMFIAVVATPDLEATRQFLETRFGLRRVTDHELPVGVLNRSFGLDSGTRHRVSSVQLAGQSVIEIDQYPFAATERPVGPGGLPPGVAFVTLEEPGPPGRPGGADGVLLRGPFGLLFELVPTT